MIDNRTGSGLVKCTYCWDLHSISWKYLLKSLLNSLFLIPHPQILILIFKFIVFSPKQCWLKWHHLRPIYQTSHSWCYKRLYNTSFHLCRSIWLSSPFYNTDARTVNVIGSTTTASLSLPYQLFCTTTIMFAKVASIFSNKTFHNFPFSRQHP